MKHEDLFNIYQHTLYIDDVKDGKVSFHKDSDIMSLSLEEAACVDVDVL